MAAYGALTTYLAELVTHKRAVPGEHILSDLARYDDLTIEELTSRRPGAHPGRPQRPGRHVGGSRPAGCDQGRRQAR